ncbi:MAG: hypothetical protein ACE5OR_10750 [bacterium]
MDYDPDLIQADVKSVEVHISYDEQQLTLNELKPTQHSENLELDYNTPSNEIIAVQFNPGAKIPPGEGSILNLSFLESGNPRITKAVLTDDDDDDVIPVIIDDPWQPDDPTSNSAVLTLAGTGGNYTVVLENPMEVGGVEVHLLSYNRAQMTLNSEQSTSRSNAFTIAHNTPSNRIIAVQYSASGAKTAGVSWPLTFQALEPCL